MGSLQEIDFPVVTTAAEMAAMDRRTIEDYGLVGLALMENAGRSVVGAMADHFGRLHDRRVAIFCGKGNNGGDGYVVARYLQKYGSQPSVYLLGSADEIGGDARTNLQIIQRMGLPIHPPGDWDPVGACQSADIVVDALLGTGVKGPLKGELAEIVEAINASRAPTVAIDLPTGVETDSGRVEGAAVRATLTVTMGALKRGLCFSPGREHAGRVFVADIGFPKGAVQEVGARTWYVDRGSARRLLPERAPNIHKNACGQVLIVAGSAGKTGAAALCSEAVLRVGAGMAILAIPESLNPILEQLLVEVMTLPVPGSDAGTFSVEAKPALAEYLDWADVVATGPGLTTHTDVQQLVEWLIQEYPKPLVMDADALNCLAGRRQVLKKRRSATVITPHPGELSRLLGKPTKNVLADPVEVARATASELDVVVVLKGAPTVVAAPEGDVYINGSGNPGMATAGMGDVLTGMITGLLAQGLPHTEAAVLGVFAHGLAGDLACEKLGVHGMIAKDVLHQLPTALHQLAKESAQCLDSSATIYRPSFGLWP